MPELLIKFGNWMFCAFLAGALFLMILIESVFNGGFWFSASHLWVPWLMLIFTYTWCYRERLYQATKSKMKPWFTAVIFYPIALLMSWPYVMGLNAITSSGQQVTYQGPIQKKWISQGKSKGYHIEILNASTKQTVTLNCSSQDYGNLFEGQFFQKLSTSADLEFLTV